MNIYLYMCIVIDNDIDVDSLKHIFNLGDLKLEKISSDDIVYPFKVYGE